ncbi:unnamed protein product, partial [Meganyctiphanes norvegica]
PDSTLGRIWTQSITTTKTNYLLQQIQSGRAAGTGLGSTVDFLIHHEFSQKATCTLYKASECILKTGLSFVFQKGSKLKEKIDPVIVNLKEFGILDKMLATALQNASMCASGAPRESKTRALEMGDIWGMNIILAVGLIVGAVVLCVEICSDKGSKLLSRGSNHNKEAGIQKKEQGVMNTQKSLSPVQN